MPDTISVTGPDGSTFAFPLGTPPAVIEGALADHYRASGSSAPPREEYPAPPPGAVSHGADGIDRTISTDGTALAVRRPFSGGVSPEQDRANAVTAAALSQRAAGDFGTGGRALLPVFAGTGMSWGDEAVASAKGFVDGLRGADGAMSRDVSKEVMRQELERERTEHPYRSAALEVAGMVPTIVGAGALGASSAGVVPHGVGAVGRTASAMASGLVDGAAIGAVQGAGSGDEGGGTRAGGAATGAEIGAAAGALLPLAIGLAKPLGLGRLAAAVAPENFTAGRLAGMLQQSGKSPEEIAAALRAAAAEGQPMFAAADALGEAGQRGLSGAVRLPSEGSQAAVEALHARQGDQGRRIAGFLSDAFGAPDTAAARQASLTSARNTAADAAYSAARDAAGPVDISKALARIDEHVAPGVNAIVSTGADVPADSLMGAMRRARSFLSDGKSVATDFDSVFRAKQEIDSMIGRADRAGDGAMVRLLSGVRGEIDDALSAASKPYAAARDQFRAGSKAIEAVDTGRNAAMRGRFEDTTEAFGRLSPEEQAAFRAGYADPLIADTQKAAFGADKSRPLLTDATRAEFPAFAGDDQGAALLRQLEREKTMFETRARATGGSRTADNLADMAASQGVDPSVLLSLAHGNVGSAVGNAVRMFAGWSSGETKKGAEKVVEVLMMRDPDKFASSLERIFAGREASDRAAREIVRVLSTHSAAALPRETHPALPAPAAR